MYPAGFVIAALIGFFMYQKYRVAPTLNLPELNLVDLEGKTTGIESFRGKKTVLCFSASWCGNCREELNTLASIKGTDLSDVTILVISDEPIEKVRALKERNGYPFVFLKMNVPFSSIGIHSIPTSYILNSKLEVKKQTVGYVDWKDPSTLKHLKVIMES